MIKALRLKNFRGFTDSGWITLAPITILLGRNSSGKSSFLRLLPLLKQSLIEDTSEPLLWFGRIVDFGGFSDILSSHATSPEFALEFKAALPRGRQREMVYTDTGEQLFFLRPDVQQISLTNPNIELAAGLSLKKRIDGEGAFVCRVSIEIEGHRLEFEANEDGIVTSSGVDGFQLRVPEKTRLMNRKGRFFPSILSPERELPKHGIQAIFESESPFFPLLLDALDPLFHGNTSKNKRRETAQRIQFGGLRAFYDSLVKHIPHTSKASPWDRSEESPPALILEAWRYRRASR
jgi:hypothetical protein